MGAKQTRHDAIRQVVRAERPGTQALLVALLRKHGYDVTQTTISRDLAELNLRKAPDGHYELAEDLHLKRMCADLVQSVEYSANLVVVKTFSGTAEGVGAALDDIGRDGVLGCVAGDDTLLVVTRDETTAKDIVDLLRTRSGKET